MNSIPPTYIRAVEKPEQKRKNLIRSGTHNGQAYLWAKNRGKERVALENRSKKRIDDACENLLILYRQRGEIEDVKKERVSWDCMDILIIEGSDDTPSVRLDKNAGIFEISGRSLPEDSVNFYSPVMNWITAYGKDPNASTEFAFKLDYFNTSSSKIILDILKLLDEIEGVSILWYSLTDDEEVKEAGEEFSEQVDIPFIFKNY